ncbi:hypothetical protein NC653_015481 [Populus alba x Populus x berolinensis]|uniref:Uncharacterized protein n=1 Tax=Populus alba x Populus x berolinensis TaxID=444605 RepID=A0AAD6VYH8_9ROSI|nr:hypothetical protein NC653_015481 [Populus alba x Populus x berolinensis]
MCAFRSSQKKFGESLPSQIKTHRSTTIDK